MLVTVLPYYQIQIKQSCDLNNYKHINTYPKMSHKALSSKKMLPDTTSTMSQK